MNLAGETVQVLERLTRHVVEVDDVTDGVEK